VLQISNWAVDHFLAKFVDIRVMNMAATSAEFSIPVLDGALPHERLPLRHPERHPPRFAFRQALRNFRTFIRDKEQTNVVFCVFDALPWPGIDRAAEAFLSTVRGREIYASEPSLVEILDDRKALRGYPEGSVAQAYCDFMDREGLLASMLVAETEAKQGGRPSYADRIQWYIDRQRDVHDLLHVLTTYGRDALGEQCVLAYVFKQRPSWGHIFIAYAGALVTRRKVRAPAPVLRAVREAQLMGKASARLAEQSIRELLAMPIDAVRKQFGIRPPHYYGEVHRVWREAGFEPF
jgi:ubiquinone biosynthesis protein COQ4